LIEALLSPNSFRIPMPKTMGKKLRQHDYPQAK